MQKPLSTKKYESFDVEYFQGNTRRSIRLLTEIGVKSTIDKFGKYGPIKVTKITREVTEY